MRVHRNATTTPKMRQLIATRAQQGWTQARIGAALGISVRTVAKWVARARQATLADGSSRPHRQPRRMAATLETAIVTLRRTRATAWQISAALGVPRSTVTRVLARAGLNRVALLEPTPPVQRYEWPHVGDLLHIDLKRLGRVTRVGHRIHGDRVLAANLGLVSSARRPHPAAAHRQRQGLPRRHLRRAVSALVGAPALHAPVSAADQRQGRAPHSDAAAGMGVSPALSQLGPPDGRPRPVSPLRQPPASTHQPRPALTVDAFPRGCLMMNNLFDIHI